MNSTYAFPRVLSNEPFCVCKELGEYRCGGELYEACKVQGELAAI